MIVEGKRIQGATASLRGLLWRRRERMGSRWQNWVALEVEILQST